MRFYPEDGEGTMSQMWHGSKWLKDLPDDLVTPMFIHPVSKEHFYVGELTSCQDGSFFIPTRWFTKKSSGMWVQGLAVNDTEVSPIRQQSILSLLTDFFPGGIRGGY